LALLVWIGARAQWFLAVGVVLALVLPGPGELLAGTLPFWVAFLLMLAMTRVDLGEIFRRAIRPRRIMTNMIFLVALMCATPLIFMSVAEALGAPRAHVEALVYTSSGPPLGSAAALCLILGLDAAFALELTVVGAFIAPFTMPVIARLLLGTAVPIDMAEMFLRLTILIGAAAIGAVIVRSVLGAARITRHRLAFDGVGSICLILFLFPLFEGIGDHILSAPAFAALTLLVAVMANIGAQAVMFFLLRPFWGRDIGGSAALMWGNRNAALALASLPPDPLLTLYVALYQFPMYFTPLVMRPIVGAPRN
jgi:hypothetical protein